MTEFNGFGVPLHVPGYFHLSGEVGLPMLNTDYEELAAVMEIVGHRLTMAEATGRWRVQGTWREPWKLVPGDILALSALYSMSLVLGRASADEDPPIYLDGTTVARTLLEARSYWLPAGAEDAVLSSDPPDAQAMAEVRLPERSCVVWLAQPATIPDGVVPAIVAQSLDQLHQFAEEELPSGERLEHPPLAAFEALDRVRRRPHECQLEGVLLVADADGTLVDGMGWVIRTPSDEPQRPDERTLVLGRRSEASWRNVIDLLAAIVSWGSWKAPEPLEAIPFDADRTALRSLRKGRMRRLEEAGGLTGVLVLDARRRPPAPTRPGTGTHASPIPHVRRGHFKRVPVGPREDRKREVRWIAPTLVNPDASGREQVRVYRLPGPPP